MFLQSTPSANLVNCSFHDNLDTALTVYNTNIILTENKFIHNQCGCESVTDMCTLGCGITALNSTLTFTGNSTFLSNKHNNSGASGVGAGAIMAVASSLNFTGTNNFCDNFYNSGDEVGVGGAIHMTNNTVLALHGTNNFINNSADNGGGAIYASDNTVLTFTGTNKFSDNWAMFGGAIYAESQVLVTFIGAMVFRFQVI